MGNKFCFLTLPSKDDGLNRHVIDFRDWARLYDIDNALGPFDVEEIDFHEVVHDKDTSAWLCRVDTRGILEASVRDEFRQSGRCHGPLCNTLIIKDRLF